MLLTDVGTSQGGGLSSLFPKLFKLRPVAMGGLLYADAGKPAVKGSRWRGNLMPPASAVAEAAVYLPGLETSVRNAAVDFGFPQNLVEKYTILRELNRGGNGVVYLVEHQQTGEEFACKSIAKILEDAPKNKRLARLEAIKREVDVLERLSGSLNVVKLNEVFEDADNVYLVMEYCRGGELLHRIGERHYSERTVASFMRGVLRTLAQCHSHHVLHRDIKPGNFMLLHEGDRAPLKAIDFGLAMPYDPDCLPKTDMTLEGTPWYMAPETLSSQVTPASDLWSAGVMAYQLLTGKYPFDDFKNQHNPSISAIWRSVLMDKLDFNRKHWDGISDEAKDFVRLLLNRDPDKRPTAKAVLEHPWLRGDSKERSTGKQLSSSVVQRIQRFAQNSFFKRNVLQFIAAELLEQQHQQVAAAAKAAMAEGGRLVLDAMDTAAMASLFHQMCFEHEDQELSRRGVSERLKQLGYRLESSELDRLFAKIDGDGDGKLDRVEFAASQVDWRAVQQSHGDVWAAAVRHCFAALDTDGDGLIRCDDIAATLRDKLPPAELRRAVRQVMRESGQDPSAKGMDYDHFVTMLRPGSVDSLEQYDDRWGRASPGSASADKINGLLGAGDSMHGGSAAGDVSVHSAAGSDLGSDLDAGQGQGGQYWGPPAPPALSYPVPIAARPSGSGGGRLPRHTAVHVSPPAAVAGGVGCFRFDTAQGGGRGGAGNGAAGAAAFAPAGAVAAVLAPQPTDRVRGGMQCDLRMHGSNLYRNMAGAGGGGGHPGGQLYRSPAGPGLRSGLESVRE